jgi:hypothetical protein
MEISQLTPLLAGKLQRIFYYILQLYMSSLIFFSLISELLTDKISSDNPENHNKNKNFTEIVHYKY